MTGDERTSWTIGHSNHSLEKFLGLVQAHRIELLADVRRFPGSRRYPQFNREALEESLARMRVSYLHFPELGGKRPARKDSPNTAWENVSFRGYADHMGTPEFRDGLNHLKNFAAKQRTAIMCAEVLWWQCHRRLMSDQLKVEGWEVLHIFSETKVEPHRLMAPAQVVDGRLSYHAALAPEQIPLLEG